MNKATKGALAVGAAVVLMLGGASSIAYWQSSAAADAANFTMGTLTVEANDDSTWRYDDEEIAPGEILLIPGSIVEYTQTFGVEATGDNLLVTATMVDDHVGDDDIEWSAGVSHSVWLEGDNDVIEYIYDGVYKVKKSGTVTVKATLHVSDWEESGRGVSFSVDNGRVLLEQVSTLPTVPPCSC